MNDSILAIYGAGSYGREILEIVNSLIHTRKTWCQVIFVDDSVPAGTLVNLIPTYAFHDVTSLFGKTIEFCIANGEPWARRKLRNKLETNGYRLAQVSDQSAIISQFSTLSPGVTISEQVVISPNSSISRNVSINKQAIIGHDVEIGEDVAISSQVNIGGGSTIGPRTFVGMGSKIREKTKIGSDCVIGMGSIVMSDVPDGVLVIGNPARVIRKYEGGKIFQSA
jgi:sugar O-acyltransferase (sialic acid O-acetyltransferase NeuD family)